jgi:DNA-binding PadR family transcriptional regulator
MINRKLQFAILACCSDEALRFIDIAQKVRSQFGDEQDFAADSDIRALLHGFVKAGLVAEEAGCPRGGEVYSLSEEGFEELESFMLDEQLFGLLC